MTRNRALLSRRSFAALLVTLSALATSLPASAQTSAANDPTVPLPANIRSQLEAVAPDPEPEALTRDSHYWVSNEEGHWIVRDTIANIGGVYIGVGTDQNYVMAGWARSSLVVMLDFDQQIANVHEAYGVLFKHATTPADFLAYWDDDRLDEVIALVNADLPPARAEAVARSLRASIHLCGARLRRLAREYTRDGVVAFVNDQTEYDFIRNLWINNRVFAIRGDLTASSAMTGIARVARDNGMPVRLLYLSNAEQYYTYDPQTVANITAMPFDDHSWVLHTRQYGNWSRVVEGNYHYALQRGTDYAAWVASGRATDFIAMARRTRRDLGNGMSLMEGTP
ncbi:MAG: hypothetical protein H6699_11555 [Myxococcales bacterium]|nr:hypothetical protein [Myxococcales bacterium]